MNKCARCGGDVPEPDIKEAIAREMDWRDSYPDEVERVLVCMPCADEIEKLEDD